MPSTTGPAPVITGMGFTEGTSSNARPLKYTMEFPTVVSSSRSFGSPIGSSDVVVTGARSTYNVNCADESGKTVCGVDVWPEEDGFVFFLAPTDSYSDNYHFVNKVTKYLNVYYDRTPPHVIITVRTPSTNQLAGLDPMVYEARFVDGPINVQADMLAGWVLIEAGEDFADGELVSAAVVEGGQGFVFSVKWDPVG